MDMKIIIRLCLITLLSLLLSGCGTLKINIDYGVSPTSLPAAPADFQATLNAVSTWTPIPSGSALPAASLTPSSEPPTNTPIDLEVADLAASRNHSCAVISDGAVKCWGNNEYGQLGNGTRVNSNVPVEVQGLVDAIAVTSGWGHVCVLTRGGGVKCWGGNADGELGNGNTEDQSLPVDVAGLTSGVIAIDAGDYHTCAVTDTNQLKCWGKNTYGQLGDWTKISSGVPVVSPFFGAGVAAVSAGWGHTCVRTTEGWAKCWGNNAYGQMGFGKPTDIHLPAEDVLNLNGRVLEVTADGAQTCALTAGGGAQCWGNNRYGQLGDGTTQKRYEPVPVAGLTSGVAMIEAGWNHACALIRGGELMCWGWNFYGQLGDGTTVNRGAPARVQFLPDGVKTIALGWGHTCVVTERNMVKCWGLNGSGQLGDGTWTDSTIPLTVIGL
jgi:alpha-tubulin suppressor-like RCC1 family protein